MNLLVEPDVVILHDTPMTPSERYRWRTAVHLEDLPGKRWHHPLERLVAGREVGVFRAVEFVRRDDGVVGSDFQHLLRRLWRFSVHREGVVAMIDGAPVGELHLE